MTTDFDSPSPGKRSARKSSAAAVDSNTVATIGAILCGGAVSLCGLLFFLVDQLPDGIEEFRQLESDTPAQLRLLILGCSAALLTVVAFVLCVVGLILPNRPRLLAALGTTVSLALLMGLFGVLLVGALMNPLAKAASPDATSAEQPTENP